MDAGLLGVAMIVAGIVIWAIDRYAPPKTTSNRGVQESFAKDVFEAAKSLPFWTLLVVLGFILVLLDNNWLTISAGGP